MSPQKQADLHAFIAACDLAVISSLSPDGTSQSAVVGIAVTRDLEIVFDTVDTSRKYRNLKINAHCSVTMWIGEVTVQYEGFAEEALDRHRQAYFEKYPDAGSRLSWPGITHFVVRPRWIRHSDFNARPPQIDEFYF